MITFPKILKEGLNLVKKQPINLLTGEKLTRREIIQTLSKIPMVQHKNYDWGTISDERLSDLWYIFDGNLWIQMSNNITEGLNLMKKPTFEILVNKYKPNHRQTTTYGYDWEFPIEAKRELDELGFDWYTVDKITNPKHPDYGKEYITINMFHDPGSRIRHLVHEGLNLVKKQPIRVGDQIKIDPSSDIFDTGFMVDLKDNTYTVIEDWPYTLLLRSNTNGNFQISIKSEDAIKISNSPYIQECLDRLPRIIEGLNLPKKQWYFSLVDNRDNEKLLYTGLNSKSIEELRSDLLIYLSLDFSVTKESEIATEEDQNDYDDWMLRTGMSLAELCDLENLACVMHTKPFEEGGVMIGDADGGEIHRMLNEGLNLPYKNKSRERATEDDITMVLGGTFNEIWDMRESPEITNNGEFMQWAENKYQELFRHITHINLPPIFLTINNADLIDVDNATINGTFLFQRSYENIKGWTKQQLIKRFIDDFNIIAKEYGIYFKVRGSDIEYYPPLS